MNDNDDRYPCVGICQADPDSGYCLGCGRPPLAEPAVVVVLETTGPATGPPFANGDPDTPA